MIASLSTCSDGHEEIAYGYRNGDPGCPACEALADQKSEHEETVNDLTAQIAGLEGENVELRAKLAAQEEE